MKILPKSFRLHPAVDKMIDDLAAHELTTRTSVIETAVKEMAKSREKSMKGQADVNKTR